MSDGATGYAAYQSTGWGATHGERQKRKSWREALKRRREGSAHGVEFVPLSMEVGWYQLMSAARIRGFRPPPEAKVSTQTSSVINTPTLVYELSEHRV